MKKLALLMVIILVFSFSCAFATENDIMPISEEGELLTTTPADGVNGVDGAENVGEVTTTPDANKAEDDTTDPSGEAPTTGIGSEEVVTKPQSSNAITGAIIAVVIVVAVVAIVAFVQKK